MTPRLFSAALATGDFGEWNRWYGAEILSSDEAATFYPGQDFSSVNFSGACLRNFDLTGCNFSGAMFSSACVRRCYAQRAVFADADFAGADL